uniref:Uncharacterized protein n=1 Tax=Timema monikensis TaxID=170555 RepID=A0A7R9HRN0_9NEOP|nr:unnamed protein product [Timema monikensis]
MNDMKADTVPPVVSYSVQDMYSLGVLDQYLTQSSSAAVTVNCVELFLSLTEEHHQHLHSEIIQQKCWMSTQKVVKLDLNDPACAKFDTCGDIDSLQHHKRETPNSHKKCPSKRGNSASKTNTQHLTPKPDEQMREDSSGVFPTAVGER